MEKENYRIIYRTEIIERENRPSDYHAMADKIYDEVTTKSKPNQEKVNRFFQKWKQYPDVWTWLHLTLTKHGRKAEARKCLDKMVEQFPDYFYGRLIRAIDFIEEKEYEEARSILGEQPDITLMMPDKTEFFYEDVLKYYTTYLDLELALGNEEIAQDLIDKAVLIDGEENTIVELMRKKFFKHRMEGMYDRMKKWKEMRLTPDYIDKNDYDNYVSQPFTHTEVQDICDGLFVAEKENIDKILSLPRETLVKDLENIILKSIYEEEDVDYDAVPSAIYFLTELKAVESYPVILQMLRQDEDYCDFWFGDMFENICKQLIYLLLLAHPEEMKAFVKEPNLRGTYYKTTVFVAQILVVARFPEKRKMVLDWFTDVLDFFYREKDNRDIIDSSLNGSIEYSILELNFKELLPVLEKFHEEKLIDEMHCGDIDAVRREFELELSQNDDKLYDIYEFFEQEKRWEENLEKSNSNVTKNNSDAENDRLNDLLKNNVGKNIEKEDTKKAGRNDPCPCGSGKKYKKCCGK